MGSHRQAFGLPAVERPQRGRAAPPVCVARGHVAAILGLQRTAGNAAVMSLLQREPIGNPVVGLTAVKFTVGKEISLDLATAAKTMASGAIDLGKLRKKALADESIGDDERMFLAGLLDPTNATQVAAAHVHAGTVFTFSRGSIVPHMAEVKDFGRKTLDPKVVQETQAAMTAATTGDWAAMDAHFAAEDAAAITQIEALATSPFRKQALDMVAWGRAHGGLRPRGMLEAMIAGASDSTEEGDMVMAGIVYTIAAAAKHPLAEEVRTGKIKVDQMTFDTKDKFAWYTPMGHGKEKGDTITVPRILDVTDLAHRRAIIHELEHATQDQASSTGGLKPAKHDVSELAAYRAGARYELNQLVALEGSPKERKAAVKALAKTLSPIFLVALVLEIRTEPDEHKRNHLEPIKEEIIDAAPAARRPASQDVDDLVDMSTAELEADLLKRIRKEYKLVDAAGNVVPAQNDDKTDARSGESMLDWIDKQ